MGTEDDTMRVYTAPIRREGAIVGVLQVGETEDDLRESLRILLVIIAVGYPLTLALASAGGIFLAGRALRPVAELTNVARQITAEDLSRRLDLDLPDDEIGRLARTFNDMITRLDEAFRRQRQFTADASHELRTPLTAIKGQTEVALQRERRPEEYREVLQAVNTEVDRLIRLAGSLLTLARADSRQVPIAREQIDLGQLVGDAAEQLRPTADAKNIRMDVSSDSLPFTGDEDLLLQLVLNLVDNAIKYTDDGGRVTVACARDGRSALIAVSDTGPGIPAEHLPRIFDRFYRADTSRSQAGGGAGLGLSIARWIAEEHGGTLTAESEPSRGSTFTARLPLASS
jgi:heavy metal sensor kinase